MKLKINLDVRFCSSLLKFLVKKREKNISNIRIKA